MHRFEVGTSAALRALHRLPWLPGPEGELHSHEYRVEAVVERPSLNERGMVCDLDVLERVLAEAVATLEGKDLELIRPPDAEAVTVEILARWFHERLSEALAVPGDGFVSIRVWESPTEFGGYGAPLA